MNISNGFKSHTLNANYDQKLVKYRLVILAILCYLESKQFEQLVVKNNFAEDKF
jgi:hypothetical protein